MSTPFEAISKLCFNSHSPIPLVRSSSDLIVHRTGKASRSIPCPSIVTKREPNRHREVSTNFRAAQILRQGPLNPTLRANPFPKLRIYFADFPYRRFSFTVKKRGLGTRFQAKSTLFQANCSGPENVFAWQSVAFAKDLVWTLWKSLFFLFFLCFLLFCFFWNSYFWNCFIFVLPVFAPGVGTEKEQPRERKRTKKRKRRKKRRRREKKTQENTRKHKKTQENTRKHKKTQERRSEEKRSGERREERGGERRREEEREEEEKKREEERRREKKREEERRREKKREEERRREEKREEERRREKKREEETKTKDKGQRTKTISTLGLKHPEASGNEALLEPALKRL